MTTRVLSGLTNRVEAQFVATVTATAGTVVARRCADLADLLAAAAASLGDVAVVSPDLHRLDRQALHQLVADGLRVIGVVEAGDETGERLLRQLGMTTVVRADIDPAALAEVLTDTSADPLDLVIAPSRDLDLGAADGAPTEPDQTGTDEETEPTAGRITAVWGPTGAPGRTTVAMSLAAELAAAGRSTLLIDADTYGASIAQAFAMLDEAPGLAAVARAAEQGSLDLPALSRRAVEVGPNLRVLTGLPRADRWPEVRTGAMEEVLRLARMLVAHVVVDCGFGIDADEELSYDTAAPRRNAVTLTTLAAADDLVVVGTAGPIGLQRLVRAVQEVAAVPSPPPIVVVNRVREGAVGPHPERAIREALARFAGLEELSFLPEARDVLDAAMLAGRTLVEQAPDSEVRLAMTRLAARVAPDLFPPRTRRARLGRRGH